MRHYLISLCVLFITLNANAVANNEFCAVPLAAPTTSTTASAPVFSPLPTLTTPNTNWAPILDWVNTSTNLCGGYFYEPPEVTAVPFPQPINTTQTTITFTGLSTFSQLAPSTLEGNVVVTQPGRILTADKAILYRNAETGKIDAIDLIGNVHYRQAGKLLVTHFAHIDLGASTLAIKSGAYNMVRPAIGGPLYGWGVVNNGYKNAKDVLFLDKATYTTCAPNNVSWRLKAKQLILDKNTGRGTAKDAWLYAGSTPLFYTPYANFPIDRRRYSGFLYPTANYNDKSGFSLSLPYYFNLAPNYDETLTTTPMTNRGLQMSSLFRYLTAGSSGFWGLSFLPNDRAFANFKQTAPQQYPPTFNNTPFLNELENDSNNRGALAYKDVTVFNPKWSGSLDLNYVTDAYYFEDFGTTPQMINTDQLLNQAVLKYQDDHWRFQSEIQAYQTLHLIDQLFVMDQYQRLPQLDLAGSFPDQAYGLDYEVNSEWVNFQHVNEFFTDQPFPTGGRIHLNPQVSLPIVDSAGFLTPALSLDLTNYSVANDAIVNTTNPTTPIFFPTPSSNLHDTRVLPIFDIDSGLYLERDFQLAHQGFRQTLEPRVFYLYVPESNQYDIPVFDTTLPTFGVEQLFRTNRFVGYDRLGDANQVSVGLTSRILDEFTGADKLNATIGEIYYFHKHTVCLYPDCSDDPTINDAVSPIAGELNFYPSPKWTLTATAAWDPNQSVMNNDGVHLIYTPAPQHLIKVGYDYVQNGDVLAGAPPDSHQNNLQRLDFGVAWPLIDHWNLLADWNYNLSHQQPQAYLYGLEYNNCCVAVRFIASRALSSENLNGTTDYQANYYVQLLFKGLGTVGNSGANDLIKTSLPGYIDYFKG